MITNEHKKQSIVMRNAKWIDIGTIEKVIKIPVRGIFKDILQLSKYSI